MSTDIREVQAGLRAWAKGVYPLEAGVELLIRTSGGRFAGSSQPWIEAGDDPGWWWVGAKQLNEVNFVALSGGEARMLRIVASLLNAEPVSLYRELAGLDRDSAEFVLAAIAHAGGSHEHTGDPVPDPHGRYRAVDGTRMSFPQLGSLHPWPEAL